jgi:hypothetical protein
MMLRRWRADLHIHTCLSPCGELEMAPRAIVERARAVGLDLIAICDHNASANTEAVVAAGARIGLAVLRGIEITTREEVHILGLFDSESNLQAVQEHVDEYLGGENDPEVFGRQVIVDGDGTEVGEERRLLIGACDLALDEVIGLIRSESGCVVAAHVDREAFGLVGHLGFVPDVPLDGLEVSPRMTVAAAREQLGLGARFEILRSSDAHRLEEVGSVASVFELAQPKASEVRLALARQEGRRVIEA